MCEFSTQWFPPIANKALLSCAKNVRESRSGPMNNKYEKSNIVPSLHSSCHSPVAVGVQQMPAKKAGFTLG